MNPLALLFVDLAVGILQQEKFLDEREFEKKTGVNLLGLLHGFPNALSVRIAEVAGADISSIDRKEG